MFLYKIVTFGDRVLYANSDIDRLSLFIKYAEKYFEAELKSVEYLGVPALINR